MEVPQRLPEELFPGAVFLAQFAILSLFFVTVLPPTAREPVIGQLFALIRKTPGPVLVVTRATYPLLIGAAKEPFANNGGIVDASKKPSGTLDLMRDSVAVIARKQFNMIALDLDGQGSCAHVNTQWLPPNFIDSYRLNETMKEPVASPLRRRMESTPGCIFVPNK